jgi:rhodanese-related sulfurtransferase
MEKRLIVFLLPILVTMACATWTLSESVSMITKDQLKAMLDNPDLTIIDVRYSKHWTGSDMQIKGAVREDPNDVKSWADKYGKDQFIVLYCA